MEGKLADQSDTVTIKIPEIEVSPDIQESDQDCGFTTKEDNGEVPVVGHHFAGKAEKRPMSDEPVAEGHRLPLTGDSQGLMEGGKQKAISEQEQLKCLFCASTNIKQYREPDGSFFCCCKSCAEIWGGPGLPFFASPSIRRASAVSTNKEESENSNNTEGHNYKESYTNYQTGTNAMQRMQGYIPTFEEICNQPQTPEPSAYQERITRILLYRRKMELKEQLMKARYLENARMISGATFTAISGQVIGGLMVHRITTSASPWAGPALEIGIVLGSCLILGGVILGGRRRTRWVLMIKTGAVIIGLAILFSMGLNLSRVVAWTLGTVLFLMMVVAAVKST